MRSSQDDVFLEYPCLIPTNIPRVPAGVEVVPILDFGSQFVQLIARRVREAGAFSILLAPRYPGGGSSSPSAEGHHSVRRSIQR